MPTIFSHGIFAVLAGKGFLKKPAWFWLTAAVCAMIPDADVVAFRFGVPYENMFGHRGFTHSIAFALLLGAAAALLVRFFRPDGYSFSKLFLFFALVTFSHPFFDMLTDGGLGVALFAPLSAERFFFPWRPIRVSPIGARFFGAEGPNVILSEIFLVWLPAAAIFLSAMIIRRFRRPN
ncbi:MAG: metal-dependent hydrolase [Acidobacteria bacterium]|nr:metal-dependent hydrolase [Acidobacteriota bacterium]